MTARRFAAVVMPRVHLEIARARLGESDANAPLAVVVAWPGSAAQTETDLLGNTRIDEVSSEARALGVRRGQTIAAARAMTDLRVRVVHVDEVRDVLASIAEAALAFGATTSFGDGASSDSPARSPRLGAVVWADVTGCAHLFGGEAALGARLGERVRAMGYACRVAIADGPRVAAAVAAHAPAHRVGPLVVPPGKNAVAMRALPLAALPLDDEACAWLSRVGMRTAGDLQRLPTRALGTRLGAITSDVMGLLRGDDSAPLVAYRPPEVIEERVELEYGIDATEALLFVTKGLCDRVAARLEGRAMAASRVELVLSLDRAMLPDEATSAGERALPNEATSAGDPATLVLSVALPAVVSRAQDLFAVLRARVDAHATAHSSRPASAPIRAVALRAPELACVEGRALALFDAEPKADLALPRLAAELAAELGEARVGVLELRDSWIPEERTRMVPYRLARGAREDRAGTFVSTVIEPSRLLGAGVPPPAPLARPKLLVRHEAVEWWRRGVASSDFAIAEIANFDTRALGWIEIRGGAAKLRGWID